MRTKTTRPSQSDVVACRASDEKTKIIKHIFAFRSVHQQECGHWSPLTDGNEHITVPVLHRKMMKHLLAERNTRQMCGKMFSHTGNRN